MFHVRTALKSVFKTIFNVHPLPCPTPAPQIFLLTRHLRASCFQKRGISYDILDKAQFDSPRRRDPSGFGVRGGFQDSSGPRATPESSQPLPPASSNILYVGNLVFEVQDEALEKEFSGFGPIRRTRIVYDTRGLSKGFGYVEFVNDADAAKALEMLNLQVFFGRRMYVQYHQPKPQPGPPINQPSEPTSTLFVGNLPFEMTDKDLNDLFAKIEEISDVRVAVDRQTGQPRGFAHADFLTVEGAIKAKEFLELKELYGRRLRVNYSSSVRSARTNQFPQS